MTPSIVEGLQTLQTSAYAPKQSLQPQDDEPSLENAAVGRPVSHSQVVDLWRALNDAGHREYTLELLLRGSKIYIPPPPPKTEPVSWLGQRTLASALLSN